MTTQATRVLDERDEWRARILRALAELRSDELASTAPVTSPPTKQDEDDDD